MGAGYGRKYADRTAASDSLCLYPEMVYQRNRRRYRHEGLGEGGRISERNTVKACI